MSMEARKRGRPAKYSDAEYRGALIHYIANNGDASKVEQLLKAENPDNYLKKSTLSHFPAAIKIAKNGGNVIEIVKGLKGSYFSKGMIKACCDFYCPGVVDFNAVDALDKSVDSILDPDSTTTENGYKQMYMDLKPSYDIAISQLEIKDNYIAALEAENREYKLRFEEMRNILDFN